MKQSTAECRPNQKHGHQLKHDRKKGTEVENYDINRWKDQRKIFSGSGRRVQQEIESLLQAGDHRSGR